MSGSVHASVCVCVYSSTYEAGRTRYRFYWQSEDILAGLHDSNVLGFIGQG